MLQWEERSLFIISMKHGIVIPLFVFSKYSKFLYYHNSLGAVKLLASSERFIFCLSNALTTEYHKVIFTLELMGRISTAEIINEITSQFEDTWDGDLIFTHSFHHLSAGGQNRFSFRSQCEIGELSVR